MIKKITITMLIMFMTGMIQLAAIQRADDSLTEVLESISYQDEQIPVYILLKDQYDAQELYYEVKRLPLSERRQMTINILREHSDQSQFSLRNTVQQLESDNQADNVRYYWIVNMIALSVSYEALQIIDSHEEIETIVYDSEQIVLFPDPDEKERALRSDDVRQKTVYQDRNVAANVNRIRAPEIWDQGYRGEGITVAVLDTGVNYNHRDIVNNMWTHVDYPNHGYNFVGNNNDPMDNNSHGTHCAGTVAGDGTSGTITGVATNASIMAVKVLADNGGAQLPHTVSGIQFAVENGADVLSMSFGWRSAPANIKNTLRTAMNNVLSAGVVASVAIGNFGRQQNQYPPPNNVGTPGSCPAPWLHPDQTLRGGLSSVISVGATDNNDRIANFSSRGPVTWSNVNPFNDYAHNPGMGLIVPDVVAPGVDVVSLNHNNNTGYTPKSGTSMAAPAVAGIIALMLSKEAELTPEEISQILEETTVAAPDTKNNTFGSGRADAYNAVEEVVGTTPPNQAIRPTPQVGAQFIGSRPTLEWSNGGGARSYRVYIGTDNPPSNTVAGDNTDDRDYTLTVDLEPQQTYYWRIDSVNDNGVTAGEVWHFETSVPHGVRDPEPSDGADDIRLLPLLRWIEQGGADSYRVYVGTDNPPTNFLNGVEAAETSYHLELSLDSTTLYYWRVDAINVNGVAEGEVWSFTTGQSAGETFASGDFSANPWDLSYTGDIEAYWHIDDTERFSGDYSARAGHIVNNATTTIAITLEIYESGSISFARKVYSASNHHLTFYIDNNNIASWSGDHDWDEVTFDVSPGIRTFRWVYDKTRPDYLEDDGAWIDHITFPYLGVPSPQLSPPINISSELAYDRINLSWELPLERPVILGHNIYRSFDGEDFEKINERIYRRNYFHDDLTTTGTYHYYVTSLFENGESGPSETVSVNVGEAVADPEFSHAEGEYPEGFELSIDIADEESVIYYTIDGTEPDPEAILYDGVIDITESTLVRAQGYKLGHLPSDVVEADYVISLALEDETHTVGSEIRVYPNPLLSQGNVRIAYSLGSAQDVSIGIYNIKGQLVRSFDMREAGAGNNSLVWDMRDERGSKVGTGIYLINVRTLDRQETKRLMIMK